MIKSSKGVTLVALVVTIIVILIIAGVTLAAALGQNGVITNASKARDDTNLNNVKVALGNAFASILSDNVDVANTEIPDNMLPYVTEDVLRDKLPGYKEISMTEMEGNEIKINFKDKDNKVYEAEVNQHLSIVNLERK